MNNPDKIKEIDEELDYLIYELWELRGYRIWAIRNKKEIDCDGKEFEWSMKKEEKDNLNKRMKESYNLSVKLYLESGKLRDSKSMKI